MNLRQLRYFHAAVKYRSVTRAAEHLHVAQPALGAHIRALEAELNVMLLDRHSRGVTPTEAGDHLYARSCEIFELIQLTEREVTAFGRNAPPTVTIGLTPSLILLIGADLQIAYGKHAPGAMLRVWEDPSFKLATAVEQGELDLALAYDVTPRAGLTLTPVMEEEMLFACHPDIAPDRSSVDLEFVLQQDLALGSTQDIARRVLARAVGLAPEDLKVRYELQSIAGIRTLLLQGSAVSVLPSGGVIHEIKAGRLAGLRIDGASVKSTLHIVTRTSKDGGVTPLADPRNVWLVEHAIRMAAERQPQLTTLLPRKGVPAQR